MPRDLPLANNASIPELDVVPIPHEIRHGAIHGALSTRDIGQAMIIIAPHNPLPLLREIAARDEEFAVEYLSEGPDAWRIQFTRIA